MRQVTVADYLVEFWIANGITDVFGYQGGMVCHIFDSLGLYAGQINYHCCGNEQGAALAACGYAQATGKLGVVITTSGPGFTNALTGLADAWFDSLPVMLISGQVNTKDKKRDYTFRQYGFQEMQTTQIADSITKRAYEIDDDTDVAAVLQDAYTTAFEGRRGPVFLDMPINIERKVLTVEDTVAPVRLKNPAAFDASRCIQQLLEAKKPIIIAGAGISQCGMRAEFRNLVELLKIPVITTMAGVDLVPTSSPYHVGYLGGTGRREAGIVLKNTDFVLSLGTRMCNKAIGYDHKDFIPMAKKLIRVDIDTTEFERKLKPCEEDITVDLRPFIRSALQYAKTVVGKHDHTPWADAVNQMQAILQGTDRTFGNDLVRHFSELLPEQASITLDVGNNQVYGAQSAVIRAGTRVFASCGLGTMGYAIPAAVGVAIGNGRTTGAVVGDGGAQMNIQELNIIARKRLPVKILVLNNRALGHIILFQEHYLDNRLVATKDANNDYFSCDFAAIGKAYGIRSHVIHDIDELDLYKDEMNDAEPLLIEAVFENCLMLPNIHGGLDPLTNGPALKQELVDRIREIMIR